MNTPENQKAHEDSQLNGRPDNIDSDQSDCDYVAADQCLDVLMLVSNYRFPESVLRDTAVGLNISRALLVFKNTEVSKPVLWNGSDVIFPDIDDELISFGIADWKDSSTTYGAILERAEKSLLEAKRLGKNQSSIG